MNDVTLEHPNLPGRTMTVRRRAMATWIAAGWHPSDVESEPKKPIKRRGRKSSEETD
jgi:hypothetical protein